MGTKAPSSILFGNETVQLPPAQSALAGLRRHIGYTIGHGDVDMAEIEAVRNFEDKPIQTDELSFALGIMVGAFMSELDTRPDLMKMKGLVFAAADEIQRRIISKLEAKYVQQG